MFETRVIHSEMRSEYMCVFKYLFVCQRKTLSRNIWYAFQMLKFCFRFYWHFVYQDESSASELLKKKGSQSTKWFSLEFLSLGTEFHFKTTIFLSNLDSTEILDSYFFNDFPLNLPSIPVSECVFVFPINVCLALIENETKLLLSRLYLEYGARKPQISWMSNWVLMEH